MTTTNKDPLIKISKRQNLALGYKLLLTVGAIFLALAIGGILLACLGYNPFEFYVQLLMGNFKNASYVKLLVRTLVPLLITSLGVSLAFKMRFWNIGGEGQFIVGAIIAMTFSLIIGDSLPSPLGAIIIVLLGALGGGVYALVVALLKVKFNTNETLMTLMLNYVAIYVASYMLKTDFFAIQGQGVPSFKVIAEQLWLTEINIGKFSFDTAVFIAVALVIILFVYFRQSKQGYELNVVGDSPNTAKYAGMKVKWIIVRTMFLSGAIIGMAGALKLCGSSAGHTFSANITGGVGWTAIIVAWLAKLNPIGIFIASLLMSILERGCDFTRTSMSMNSAISDVLQGIILFTVLACDFFTGYKVTFRKKAKATVSASETQDSGTEQSDDENLSAAETAAQNVVKDDTPEQNAADEITETSAPVQDAPPAAADETPPDEEKAEESELSPTENKQITSEGETPSQTEKIQSEEEKIPEPKDAQAEETPVETAQNAVKAEKTSSPAKKTDTKKKTPAKKTTSKATAKTTVAKKPATKKTSSKAVTSAAKTAQSQQKKSAANKTSKKSAQVKKTVKAKGGADNE